MADLRMPDLNTVMIAGNLVKDPKLSHTMNGTPVSNFTIASNRRFKDSFGEVKEDVCFIGVVAWYNLALSCAENLHKGSAVLVTGELQSRQLTADDGSFRNMVEIKARRIQFLNKPEFDMEESQPSGFRRVDSDEGESSSPADDNSEEQGKDKDYDFGFRELRL